MKENEVKRIRVMVARHDETTELWLALIGRCGMKVCELANLRNESIQTQVDGSGLAQVCCQAGRCRPVQIGLSVMRELKRFTDAEPGWVFTWPDGQPYTGDYVSHWLNRVLRRDGRLETAMMLRHRFPNE